MELLSELILCPLQVAGGHKSGQQQLTAARTCFVIFAVFLSDRHTGELKAIKRGHHPPPRFGKELTSLHYLGLDFCAGQTFG